jgi:hypothetical protein
MVVDASRVRAGSTRLRPEVPVTDRASARAAKTQVRRLVEGHSSVNGIGLRRDADAGWVVKVNLAGEDAGLRRSLPPRVDGVRVDVAVVGPVTASTASTD